MGETCVAAGQDMPMCERKDVLDKLEGMVAELERTQKSVRQVPKVLIRSDVCECKKGGTKETERGRIPQQSLGHTGSEGGGGCARVGRGDLKQAGGGCVGVPEGAALQGPVPVTCAGGGCVRVPEGPQLQGPGPVTGVGGGCVRVPEGAALVTAAGEGGSDKAKEDTSSKRMCPTQETEAKGTGCYKRQAADPKLAELKSGEPAPSPHPLLPVPRPHGFELRASKMLVGCDCLRRNGMQHDCQRKECQGTRECLHFPAPVCVPSGLAPPVVIPSPIITVDEPDCGPKKVKEQSKTQMEQRRILLNYAKAQFQSHPPRPPGASVPCRFHVKGKYYIRPLQAAISTQTGDQGGSEK